MTLPDVLDRLAAMGCAPRRSGRGWLAKCPAHPDGTPSLSVREGQGGRVLLYDFGGCTFARLAEVLGLADLHGIGSPFVPPPADAPPAWLPDLAERFRRELAPARLAELAGGLGVAPAALERLGAGWCARHGGLALPMLDGAGALVGIQVRKADGSKHTLRGSRLGLFVPELLDPSRGLWLAEGASDAAALLTLGLEAAGRASASSCSAEVLALARRQGASQATICGDNDPAGRRGAWDLARLLGGAGLDVRCILPPRDAKDARAAVLCGATRADFERAAVTAQPVRGAA